MFDVTIIIYLYLYIIISTILFDVGYNFYQKLLEKNGVKKRANYQKYIEEEIKNLRRRKRKDEDHFAFFNKKLKNIHNLLIYQEVLDILEKENRKETEQYLLTYSDLFQNLAMNYSKKESIYKAFFALFLAKHYPFDLYENSYIDEQMILYTQDKSIYCRENAMLYLYQRASSTLIIRALKMMSRKHLYYNKKLLANDLLKYKGNKEQFALDLLNTFPEFSSDIQIGVINYLRFSSHDLNETFKNMLTSGKYDKEVDLALIRYFGRNVYLPILPILISYLKEENEEKIEYKIITAQVIKAYDLKEVRDQLIRCLKDRNWYVRKNSATSLADMKLTKENIEQIEAMDDRYAKEMIRYIFTNKEKERTRKVCTN